MKRKIAALAFTSSIFSWPELRQGIEERKVRERQLRVISQNGQQRLQDLSRLLNQGKINKEEYQDRYESLKTEIVQQAQKVTFGGRTKEEREGFLRENGCVKINQEAIEAIKAIKRKIIEIGAGSGHWAKALQDVGLDIIAFDSFENVPIKDQKVFDVKKVQTEEDLKRILQKHSERALLLVYPPPGPFALKSVQTHGGKILIYCGEGYGGANADEAFFDYVDKYYKPLSTVYKFETFDDNSFERLWVLEKQGN